MNKQKRKKVYGQHDLLDFLVELAIVLLGIASFFAGIFGLIIGVIGIAWVIMSNTFRNSFMKFVHGIGGVTKVGFITYTVIITLQLVVIGSHLAGLI